MGITKPLEYVRNNKDALTKKYDGKYVVVSEQLEETHFDTLDAAYMFGTEKIWIGKFRVTIIQ